MISLSYDFFSPNDIFQLLSLKCVQLVLTFVLKPR